jgi:S-(hydroxymethyl)glutathione dehydrogenase/alcohol dehydrogenase
MRAVVLGRDRQVEIRDDVTTAPLRPDDVRVRMRASGVCRTDLSAVTGAWPTKRPCVLGHEGAGEVVEVGSAVEHVRAGQRVIPVGLAPCDRCYFCVNGQPFLCERGEHDGQARVNFAVGGDPAHGMVGLGTWAEELVVPERMAIPFDDAIPYDVASLVGCAVMTGVGAVLNTAQVRAGDSVAVIGGGGIGSAVIQGARLAGAGLILAVDPAVAKHDSLRRFGATHTAAPDELDAAVRELTDGRGFDHAFENVGRPETIRSAWRAARRGGKVIVTGLGGREAAVPFDAHELAFDGKTLIGNAAGQCTPAGTSSATSSWRRSASSTSKG